jgi:tetratricopeptide (TPR) repeat protein
LLRQLGQASLPATDTRAARTAAKDAAADVETDERLAQLESALALAGLKPAEAMPLVAPLLNLQVSAKYALPPMLPEQQRRRLLATLVEWVLGAGRAQPLVVAIEDLHWADPSSLELIHLLAEQGAAAPLMLLYTARPEFRPQWPLRAHHTQLTLNRLSARNVREMIAQVAVRNALADETVNSVIERTGGVPLFVEELTRAVLESGSAKLAGCEIPVTLHDSLMARLDRLGSAKEVLQIGAVIGSDFSYELLHAVHPIGEQDLQTALHDATDAELVYVRGIAPEATYQFKHALIRDAAYEALLKSRRREVHRQVALAINGFPALKEEHPAFLAHHWTEAGETAHAIAEWSRAGQAAEARNAFIEAQEDYQQALSLINLLPESPERDLRELELRQAIVRILFITKGHSDSQAAEAAERASLLAQQSGNIRQLLNLIITRGVSALISGEVTVGCALADRALELAAREETPSIQGGVRYLQTMAHFYRGDLAGAEKHFIEGLQSFEHPGLRRIPGVAIAAFHMGAFTAWLSGRADIARQRIARMLAVANPSNPFEVAFSGGFGAELLAWMREYEQAEAAAGPALEVAEKNNFIEILAVCRWVIGQVRVESGHPSEGVSLIRQGIAGMQRLRYAARMATLAQAQHGAGSLVDALETIEQALQAVPDVPSRAEILRISGELRLENGQTELAKSDLHAALDLARNLGAKAWELRATMSLARLLAGQGRRKEARAILAEIYNWFTEGFDTADLKDAKALLDELSP